MAQSNRIIAKGVRVEDVVYSPNEAANEALATIEERRTQIGAGIRTGLSSLDNCLNPIRPGQICGVIGRTSNYKTGFMQFWARAAARQIIGDKELGQAVFYITWEQAVEELLAMDMATAASISATDIYQGRVSDDQMLKLREAAFQRTGLPLWIIGHSIREGKSRPPLTLSMVAQAFELVRKEYGLTPRAVYMDYLQLIQNEQGEQDMDRRTKVGRDIQRSKDMTIAMQCPVILGTQANRESYGNAWGVPGIKDSMESAYFHYTMDAMVGVWLPKTNCDIGSCVDMRDGREKRRLEVTKNLLIVQVLKQKMGDAGDAFPFYVDLTKNFVAEMAREPPF